MKVESKEQETGLEHLRVAAGRELDNILHWWSSNMVDHENGGFYGRIDGYGRLHSEADKGVILNTRILWTFSAAARRTGDRHYRDLAERACDYVTRYFRDEEFGGVFWTVDFKGNPAESKKQVYAQAFAVYALAEYYLSSNNPAALESAQSIFEQIERHSRDRVKGGYFEAFSRDWSALGDLRLSDKDANEAKTMNTHLHLLEAYTTLYKAWPDAEVRDALAALTGLFLDTFIDPDTAHLHLFFDENWVSKSDKISFGHDIETAWLLMEAAETLGDPALTARARAAAVRIADRTIAEGYDPANGGLWNEADAHGLSDRDKEWWPQIEAVVGFLRVWQNTGEPRFAAAALRSWSFIEKHLPDPENGEWFWGLKADGTPNRAQDKAGLWKCPYHNSRGCMEILSLLRSGHVKD